MLNALRKQVIIQFGLAAVVILGGEPSSKIVEGEMSSDRIRIFVPYVTSSRPPSSIPERSLFQEEVRRNE